MSVLTTVLNTNSSMRKCDVETMIQTYQDTTVLSHQIACCIYIFLLCVFGGNAHCVNLSVNSTEISCFCFLFSHPQTPIPSPRPLLWPGRSWGAQWHWTSRTSEIGGQRRVSARWEEQGQPQTLESYTYNYTHHMLMTSIPNTKLIWCMNSSGL